MDPSAYNFQRLSNAGKAMNDWKNKKNIGPVSPWGALILFVIIVAGLVVMYYHANAKPKYNWTVLQYVPAAQATRVENNVKKLEYPILFPASIPGMKVTQTDSNLSQANFYQSLTVVFADGHTSIFEKTANETRILSSIQLTRRQKLRLPDGTNAVAGNDTNNQLSLYWNHKGIAYTLTGSPSTTINQLVNVYKNMALPN